MNILTLNRPGKDGFASVWDGNKYIQCRRMPDQALRCESAGALMQPSLARVLTPARIARLGSLGWRLDPSFGNYVQTFPAGVAASFVADRIVEALADGYSADVPNLEVLTDFIESTPCPPRNGPSQNLAGLVNDSESMAANAVYGCAFEDSPGEERGPPVLSAADLIRIYGARVTGEIQRLRVNIDQWVFFVAETGGGYVQCAPAEHIPPAIYCEAQSAESWPVLARILTSDRVARLHQIGFDDPGYSPNYSKMYPIEQFADVAIANELLTILFEVYAYNGDPKLEFKSENGKE